MVKRLIPALFLCASINATTWYVRKDGHNNNTGQADSAGGAFLTINRAAQFVQPGDTVYVRAGTYQEYVALTNSGTLASPIRWYGAGGYGAWTTIVDPSQVIAGTWTHATNEVGLNVWKRSFTGYTPTTLIADGYVVARFKDSRRGELARTTDSTITIDGQWTAQPFWDGIEAGWNYTSGVIYLRFRDNSHPDTHTIRISDNGTGTFLNAPTQAALLIKAAYNTWSGFDVRGTQFPVVIRPTAAGDFLGNIIESNKVSTGFGQVLLSGGGNIGANVSSNIVRMNLLTQQGYWETGGTTGGAQRYGVGGWPNFQVYNSSKNYWYGNAGSGLESGAVSLISVRNGNVVHNNVISNGVHASRFSDAQSGITPTGNTIASNQIYNISGALGIWNSHGDLSYLHDNQIQNAWMGFGRYQSVNNIRSGQNRVYIYRNNLWNPNYLGNAGYIHANDSPTATFQSEIWWYHNSYEGGGTGVGIGIYAGNPTSIYGKMRWINNILSCTSPFDNNAQYFGQVSYNRMRQYITAWPNNLVNGAYVWGGSAPSATMPSFLITDASTTWNAGTNLAGLSLPDSRTLVGVAWDIGSHEYSTGVELPNVHVTALSSEVFENGSAVTIRITRNKTTTGDLSGTWTITGTAENGTHCSTISTSWTIDDGDEYVDVTLTPQADNKRTGDLYFVFTIAADADYTVAGSPATVFYRDTDRDLTIESNPPLPGQFRPFRL